MAASALLLLLVGVSSLAAASAQVDCQCDAREMCTAAGEATFDVTLTLNKPAAKFIRPAGFGLTAPSYISHSPCSRFYRNAENATAGLAQYTREGTGNYTALTAQNKAHGVNSLSYIAGTQVNDGGRSATKVQVKADNKRFVLTGMSALVDSPDWFVGVDSVRLCQSSQFIQAVTYDLYPFDAGVESGTKFGFFNESSPVTRVVSQISFNGSEGLYYSNNTAAASLATLTIQRVSVDSSKTALATNCNLCSGTAALTCKTSFDRNRGKVTSGADSFAQHVSVFALLLAALSVSLLA